MNQEPPIGKTQEERELEAALKAAEERDRQLEESDRQTREVLEKAMAALKQAEGGDDTNSASTPQATPQAEKPVTPPAPQPPEPKPIEDPDSIVNKRDKETQKKNKKETAPKTPKEQAKDFIAEFKLESLLPSEFERLNDGQKLKVIQDLKRRIVDIVKAGAQTQYSDELKNKPWWKKFAKNSIKGIKNSEQKVFEEFKNSPETQEIVRKDLEILTKKTQGRDVFISQSGHAWVDYLGSEEGKKVGLEIWANLNSKAGEFVNMPYEWGQEKQRGSKWNPEIFFKGHKTRYEKAKTEYEKARNEVLQVMASKETAENKGSAILKMLEVDNSVQMEQLLSTHPEFEEALDDFSRTAGAKETVKNAWNFLNTITGGKKWEYKLATAGGFGLRMAAKGAVWFSGATMITAVSAPVIGATIGGIKARLRAKDTLIERQRNARQGQKDKSAEKIVTTDAAHLNKRLVQIMTEIEVAGTAEEHAKKLAMLTTRIEHTQGKIEKGQVNFGDSRSALGNQFDLINNLTRALTLREMMSEKINREVKGRIDNLLAIQGKNIAEKTSQSQKEFINKQMWKGVVYGATFAVGGYVLRYVGEQLGVWEYVHGQAEGFFKRVEDFISKHNPLGSSQEAATSSAKSALEKGGSVVKKASEKTAAAIKRQVAAVETHQSAQTPAASVSSAHATPDHPAPTPSAPIQPTSVPETFAPTTGVTFEHGKGAIQGIKDLKEQIRHQFDPEHKGDYSSLPKKLQDFMKERDLVKQAKELGLYDPNHARESALLSDDASLKFDEHGNIVFRVNASQDFKILQNYKDNGGRMFDSDHSGAHHTVTKTVETQSQPQPAAEVAKPAATPETPAQPVTAPAVNIPEHPQIVSDTHTQATDAHKALIEEQRTKVLGHMDRVSVDHSAPIEHGASQAQPATVNIGYNPNLYNSGPGSKVPGMYGQGYNNGIGRVYTYDGKNNTLIFTGGAIEREYDLSGLSHEQVQEFTQMLNHHPEFAADPYNLSSMKLLKAYEASQKNIHLLFRDNKWRTLKDVKAGKIIGIKDTKKLDSSSTKLVIYLQLLKKFTGQGPQGMNILRLKSSENAEEYVDRSLQLLASGQGKVTLDEFEAYMAATQTL